MGSHTLDILRQGILPSFTGGWYYDANQSTFSNIFHLYLWLFLLAFPLTLYLTVATSIFVWMIYCGVVGLVFAIIKSINYKLHHMFDTSEGFEEALDKFAEKNTSQTKVDSRRSSAKSNHKNGDNSDSEEYIEMSVMNRSQNCTITPPVHHSSRNSVILETQPVHKETNTSHQLDVEDSKNDAVLRVEAGGDGTSSLLPMSSSSSSVMMMMMMDSSGGVGGGDSGGGAVLETVEVHNTSPTTSKPPSPTDTTTATTAAITTTTTTTTSTTTTAAAAVADHDDDDDDNVDNADADDADDTATPNVALPAVLSTSGSAPPSSSRSPTFRYSFSSSSHSSVSERSSARSLSASSSSLASFVSSYSTVSLSSCPSTTVEPPGTVDESTSTTTTTTTNPTSSSSSSSSSTTTTSTATSPSTTTSTTITACPTATTTTSTTPNSPTTSTTANTPPPTVEPVDVTVTVETAEEPAEDFSPLPSSPVPPSTPPPPSSPPSPPPPPPSVPAVIVSSPVALKQPAKVSLHATGESRSQLEVSESTSTITNDDTSPAATGGDGFDDDISPAGDREQPGQYHLLKEHDNTSPSSPSQDELDLKHCGAIPKKYSLKQSADPQLQSQNLSSSPSDEGPFGASPDPPDPETLCRNIIEILDDNNEFPEKMRKLKAVVQPTKKSYYRNEDQSKESRLKEPTLMKDKATSPAELGAIGGTTQEDGDTRSTDSKSVTPTEASALLPLKDILNKEDSQSRRRRYRRETGRVNMRRVHTRRSPPLRAALFNIIAGGHLASSHDDTTEGAMHYFQDEVGNWFTYTFGENSSGVAQGVIDMDLVKSNDKSFHESTSSSGSGSPVVIEPSPKREEQAIVCRERSLDFHSNLRPTQAFYPWQIESQWGLVEPFGSGHPNVDDISDSPSVTEVSSGHQSIDKPKQFYKFWLFPNKYIKIHFDRLELLALLDRNLTVIENLIAILMAVAVSSLGALVLSSHFYKDFYIFIFCFILASCQYSLLKSVQPDSASPMHGYNRLIVFSRPFYFCLCCGLLKFLDYTIHHASSTSFIIYGFPFTATASLTFAKSLMKVFILLLPVLFMVGLLPQVKTFFMYILEQTDMHIFGGNATTSLGAAVYSVTRSLVAVAALYFFCYYALKQKESSQHVLFSIFCALSVAISYHLSRSASHPGVLGSLIKDMICGKKSSQTKEPGENELIDPLPDKLKKCVSDRLQSDLLVCILFAVIMFAVHVSTVFNSPVLQPYLSDVLCYLAASLGFIIHYIIPQMRKEMPWLCCYTPILPSYEGKHMESDDPAPIMCFEKLYIWLRFVERNIVYPVVFLCALTLSAPLLVKKFGLYFGSVIVVVCGLKLLRFAFSDTLKQHMILAFTVLFFKYDYKAASETFLLDYFVISILFCKFCDLLLKVKFIITYIAPWQITWGSAFHAFAQPFSVPHSAMLFVQAAISAIFSTPLNPFLGSAIFITSYIRPVKFWERDYNTKRVDHSNTCLASQLERNPDDNNLNSIFYEHLTRSLQHSLCGDVMMGRWGNYCQGDCFIMASDYLNALVHIIETGNGLVTFQLRGLEFRGTYCQQREVEAITEEVNNDEGFCCCELGHLPHLLSLNAAFNQRWLAWEVMVTNYILEGYSISDNSAATMLQVFDLRKLLINYYIKSIIYYTVRSPCLDQWSQNEELRVALAPLQCNDYVDLDPTFNAHVDDDYDSRLLGITRNSFCNVYFSWIQFCAARREKSVESGKDSFLVSLCYGLSLLGRRALCTASHNGASVGVDYFLFRLHALFKGDFRVTSSRDEWVVKDVELLRRVVAPALRMSLKLHQDHFASSDEYDDLQVLYNAISNYEKNMVISHEADPAWRNAVLSNTNSLLALRHVFDEELDEYKIIMLNKRYLSFRIVKVNRECVRGLWAGQQQELIFLRNRNPERGSIQNAKQALRNMINSSCDQPIGYPIYVSPLTTSYSSTHEQLATIIGGEFLLSNVKSFFKNLWFRMRRHCGASCAGRSSGFQEEATYTSACTHAAAAVQLGSMRSNSNSAPPTTGAPSVGGGAATTGSGAVSPSNQSDITLQNLTNSHNSKLSSPAAVTTATTTPTSTATTTPSITALLDSRSSSSGNGVPATAPTAPTVVTSTAPGSNPVNTTTKEPTISQRVRIMDPSQMYDNMNLGRRIDVQWPRDDWKQNGGKSGWNGWTPTKGLEGTIVHRWVPCHRDPVCRSHVDYTILLVQVGSDKYVPIADGGVMHLGVEV
ncbi:1,Pecanex 2,Pecanex 3, pecanex [Octopus vulgaris]|uniref:Pecanex-like protein n=2 Tax=Octopus vulgaris TaxID=6645 RepID=A0AA36AYA4_OCTVU|nr:1,Pecanex 2,Pecanex 3, pecanex [Octopus vulgaris]